MKQLTDNPEETTQGSNLTNSRMPRRRSESPWFWVQLVGGSLVFHGALLAIALPFSARLSAASQSGSPTPVEFVELSEPSPDSAASQPPIKSTAPAASPEPVPEKSQSASNEIPPSDISFAPAPSSTISPLPIPAPEVSPLLESSPQPSPEISPSPETQTETPFETAAVSPQPNSLPLPVLPSASPAQPSPNPPQPEQRVSEITPEPPVPKPSASGDSTNRSSDRPQTETSPTEPTATIPPAPQPRTLPSDPGLQTTAINIPVPDVSEAIAAAPSTVDSDHLNSANSEAAPVGVTLSLSSSSQVDPDGDKTLELARPIENSTTFLPDPSASACQITPDVLNRVGTPIALQIATDELGEVKNVKVYQSSGSLDYDQLAACLVKKQWRFEPATAMNASGTQREAIASDELLITITINRS